MTDREDTPKKCPSCKGLFITETLYSWVCADCGMVKPSDVIIRDGGLYQDDEGSYYTITEYTNQDDCITFTLVNLDDPDNIDAEAFELSDSDWPTIVNQLSLTEVKKDK